MIRKVLGEVLTAIVTPFKRNGSVDVDSFRALARHLVDNGSDGLVVAGTTGEAPTLSDDERLELFGAALDEVGDRATVVAGTGLVFHDAHSVERQGRHQGLYGSALGERPRGRRVLPGAAVSQVGAAMFTLGAASSASTRAWS